MATIKQLTHRLEQAKARLVKGTAEWKQAVAAVREVPEGQEKRLDRAKAKVATLNAAKVAYKHQVAALKADLWAAKDAAKKESKAAKEATKATPAV